MSLLSLFGLSTKSLSPAPSDDFWYGPAGTTTIAGVKVDEQVAMTFSACWAATMVLCSSEAMIPLKLFRKLPQGGSEPMVDDPRYTLVHDSPNPDMTSYMFRSSRTSQQVNWGNGFAEIVFNKAGVAAGLQPIHAARIPKSTNIKRGSDGRLRYFVNNDNGTKTELKDWQVLHVPSPISEDGIVGRGVVENARLSIGLGLATETQGAAFFGNSARPKLVIEGTKFKSKEDKDEFLRQWMATHGSPENNARPALTPEGAKVTALQFSAEDSQFLETRQFSIEDIGRWYGVSPHLIGHLLRATYSNIEHLSLEFVKYSLMRWLVAWEQELNKKLLTPEERKTMFFRHVVDGLERGDLASRTTANKEQVFNGKRTINEWRALDDEPPIGPAGDVHWVQQAMIPVEWAAKGPQNSPPDQTPREPGDDGDLSVQREIAELRQRIEAIAKPDNETAELRQQLRAAQDSQKRLASAMLRDVMARMVSLEVNAVKRVAEKPSRFDARLREFYDKHAVTLSRNLSEPVSAMLAAAGDSRESAVVVQTIASAHVEESLRQLDALCTCTADQLEGRVAECVEKWHEERTTLGELQCN